ncbi:hypothetical protein [Pelagibacterium luteolum]|uniref:Uncharacterized protein n=1 Tax=Pelagibacterium luteolum TaxID=440168 RepID=A0A1G7S6Z8_9HYPH|nr:hypothetical protein [Pelagibacterium luteolum]SDG18768.1 hypothetical protein SAMN04487974_101340 [Pelagibacterium luteolum]
MTSLYHERALPRNDTGLPNFWMADLSPTTPPERDCEPQRGLTSGGRLVFSRTGRPASTCNAIARLAGIGEPEHV